MTTPAECMVLGSNSPAGQDFIDLVLSETDWRVRAVSRSPEKPDFLLRYKSHRYAKHVAFEQRNLVLKPIDFEHEYVVNFAAQSEVEPSWQNPDDWFRTNVSMLTNPFWSRKSHMVQSYVQLSTPEVYGSGTHKPDASFNPSTPYAMSKASADWLLSAYRRQFGLPVVSVRPANYYGPRQQLWKIVPRTILACVNKTKFALHADGADQRCFIHIRDASHGILAALRGGNVGAAYHLTDQRLMTIREVVSIVAAAFNRTVEDVTFPAPRRQGNDPLYHMLPAEPPGWEPRVKFEQGVDETIKWMRDNWAALQQQPMEYVHRT